MGTTAQRGATCFEGKVMVPKPIEYMMMAAIAFAIGFIIPLAA